MSVSELTPKLTSLSAAFAVDDPDHFIQRAILAAIVDSSDDAIVSKTLEGRILTWNRGATRIFGYEADEVVGKPITIIIPPELHEEEKQILEKLRRGERIEQFDTIRVTKDGRRLAISLTVSPVRDVNGRVIGASKVARDISDRKRAEEALRQSEETLREADRRKDEFLAVLAHELRNPLAPIRYALAANKKAGRTPEQRRQTDEIIERQINHMSRLLDDLLDISRITQGTLELKKRPVELISVVGTAVETARPVLDAKHHTLSVELPKEVRLEADPVRLAQVISNLLINAAKYTDARGHIQLLAAQDRGELVISVRDDGIGISADMLPRLFTLFCQEQEARGRAQGGLGVGLSLVRGLVTLHGGSVEARSDGPGAGSEFIVRLPAHATAEWAVEGAVVDASPRGSPLRILVVDDNRDAADTCTMLLQLSGHHVQTAYTAREALERGRGFRPQVLLLDIELPDVDGYTLAQQVRATPWGRGAVLIAVTGWGREDDRLQAESAGFDHHLVKPIDGERIEALLRSLCKRNPDAA